MNGSLGRRLIQPAAIAILILLVLSGAARAQDDAESLETVTIEALSRREYGSPDGLQAHQVFEANADFTRYIVSYLSDGLRIYGFMNVPVGEGPFPVVILIHGYMPTATYQTLTYTTRYADALARAGFLVIHPNLRNHFPSDSAPDQPFFSVGYAMDVLNLIADVERDAGKTETLAAALPEWIGLWGHSMGGGIAIRAMVVNPNVDAAVLYGTMSADEYLNYDRIYTYWMGGAEGLEEISTPPEILAQISPVTYLDRTEAAVSIHYGAQDSDVPPAWSIELCGQLEALGEDVECFGYEGQDHILAGASDRLFHERAVEFFNSTLPQDQ